TLGFWSNKNGYDKMNDGSSISSEIQLLGSLNLRNANGTNFDPLCYCATGACPPGGVPANIPAACTTATALRSWILNATATNMAYMLSAQLAAMELNVEAGSVSGGALVFAGIPPAGCSVPVNAAGFISITSLMSAANTDLNTNSDTTASGPARSCQEF